MCKLLFLRLWHSTTFKLIILSFIVYNMNLRSITSLDTYSTRILPTSIVEEFNLDLDEFSFMHKYPDWAGGRQETLLPHHYARSLYVILSNYASDSFRSDICCPNTVRHGVC